MLGLHNKRKLWLLLQEKKTKRLKRQKFPECGLLIDVGVLDRFVLFHLEL